MTNEQIEEMLEKALADNDCETAEQIVADNEDDYEGDIAEAAFRIAVQQACYDYVSDHYEDVELNDIDGCWSSYLHETEDESIIDLLTSVGAYRDWDEFCDYKFAVETVNNTVLAFDEEFHKEIWDKVVSILGLTEAQIAKKLESGEAEEYELPDEISGMDTGTLQELCDVLLVTAEGDTLSLDEYSGDECGWQLRELVESLGWDCAFEGESWKFETNGVYYLK